MDLFGYPECDGLGNVGQRKVEWVRRSGGPRVMSSEQRGFSHGYMRLSITRSQEVDGRSSTYVDMLRAFRTTYVDTFRALGQLLRQADF